MQLNVYKMLPPDWKKSRKRYERNVSDDWQKNYLEYLSSDDWVFRSRCFKIDAGNKCSICKNTKNLVVHHKHYLTLGKEAENDVVVCCQKCHLNLFHPDKKRVVKTWADI